MVRVKIVLICISILLLVYLVDKWVLVPKHVGTSPEYLALNNVGLGIQLAAQRDGAILPTHWQQITQYCELDKLNFMLSRQGKVFLLEENYVFVSNAPALPGIVNRRIVLARTSPKRDAEGSVGRYVVYIEDGMCRAKWIPENQFNLLMQSFQLPVPDYEHIRVARTNVERLLKEKR